MELLRKILLKAIEMNDNGEFDDIPEEEVKLIAEIIHEPKTVGREEAAKFLGVSLNHFHCLRDQGLIPNPRKRKGFKEKEYYISDLKESLTKLQMQSSKIR